MKAKLRCSECIWKSEQGKCENEPGKPVNLAPRYQGKFSSKGRRDDDCIGFEYYESEARTQA